MGNWALGIGLGVLSLSSALAKRVRTEGGLGGT